MPFGRLIFLRVQSKFRSVIKQRRQSSQSLMPITLNIEEFRVETKLLKRGCWGCRKFEWFGIKEITPYQVGYPFG